MLRVRVQKARTSPPTFILVLDSDSCIALDHIDLTRLHQRKRSLVEGVLPEEDGDITGVIE